MELTERTKEILFALAKNNHKDDPERFGKIAKDIVVNTTEPICNIEVNVKDRKFLPNTGYIHILRLIDKNTPYLKEVSTNKVKYSYPLTEKEYDAEKIDYRNNDGPPNYFKAWMEDIAECVKKNEIQNIMLIQLDHALLHNKDANLKVMVKTEFIKPEEATYVIMNFKTYTRIDKYKTIMENGETIELFSLLTKEEYEKEQTYLAKTKRNKEIQPC